MSNAHLGEQSDIELLDALRPQDSVKFVVQDKEDCQYALDIIARARFQVRSSFLRFLQRLSTTGTVYPGQQPPGAFQVQLHKLIGVK